MKKVKKSLKINRKKYYIISCFIIILLLIVASVYIYTKSNKATIYEPTSQDIASGIDYDPPTEDDQKSNNDAKVRAEQQQTLEQNEQGSEKKKVPVTISSAQQYQGSIELYAHVSGVVESSGTCTATFTMGSNRITKSSPGVGDATTTVCTPIVFPDSELITGGWGVSVAYTSNSAQGTSSITKFEVY